MGKLLGKCSLDNLQDQTTNLQPITRDFISLGKFIKTNLNFSAKVVEEIARKLGKEKGGEAGLSAGRLAGARAAVAAAKLEAAKVRYFIFLDISYLICPTVPG